MFKETPASIRITFWKHTLLYCAIVVFGLIWSAAIRDKDLLFLTAAIAILGAWRTIHLYQIIRHTKYRTLEGVVVSDVQCPLRSGHCVTIQQEDGSQTNELISGSRLFAPAQLCRLFLYSSIQQDVVSALPEKLRPSQTMLGYELLQSDPQEHE